MSEVSGVIEKDLVRSTVAGITYTYPATPINNEHLSLAANLSVSHADGDIVPLQTDPNSYPAQKAFFLSNQPQSAEFVAKMGELVDSRFKGLLDNILSDPKKVKALTNMGEHLEAEDTVINAVPHGTLLDIGLTHAIAYSGLGRLGYEFRSGIIISLGVAWLGKDFGDQKVPLASALAWACHKVWLVAPRTPKTRTSDFGQNVPADQINWRNHVIGRDIKTEQEKGGMLITVAPSATSYEPDAQGVNWLAAPAMGTLKMMSGYRTFISLAAGLFKDTAVPAYALSDELKQIGGNNRQLASQGDELLEEMTAMLNATRVGRFAFRQASKQPSSHANGQA